MNEIWGIFIWSITTCPLVSSKNGQLIWTMWWRRAHSTIRQKPRPDRSRVSGLRTEECGDLNFLDHGSAKIGDKNLSIFDCFGWRDITFDSVSTWKFLSVRNHYQTSWMDGHFSDESKGVSIIQTFCRMLNVKRLPTGPHAPWPNRAEMGVRLFNNFLSLHLWVQPLKIWTTPLCHRLHLPTKKAETFSPQQLQGFWFELKIKNP